MSEQPARFRGFPAGRVRQMRLPEPFFHDLLPLIDHLGELKLTLYAMWILDQLEGDFRLLRRSHFTNDPALLAALGGEAGLDEALARAALRGTLLQARVDLAQGPEIIYVLNTPRGQAAISAIAAGDWQPSGDPQQPIRLQAPRPNIFRLYEENIGPLTPMIADTLKEAETTYPDTWIEDAMRIAIENNVRRWRYIEAILRAWKEEGRDEKARGFTQKDSRRFIEGEFAQFIHH
ncbi:MAG TPA: DnaD domain protein [Anaerolineaceae bacterium]|nr:DnaD domain protein [Anaerolineaceae bacterium]HPN53741.1 DnaD domain protein [Anaerolineaceae bacterium]